MKPHIPSVIVNLGKYTAQGNRYFTTRSRGSNISREIKLDKCVNENKVVELEFPSNLSGINTLFLEELLEAAVFALNGNVKFKDLVHIRNNSLYSVEALVKKAVESIEQRKEELQASI